MEKKIKINWFVGLSTLLILSNCASSGDSPVNYNNKKIIHFEEQWVIPPPDFDTTKLSAVTEYNREGNPIEKSQYSRYDGSVAILTKWTYDKHSNITSKIVNNKEVNTVFEETFSYEYDKKGRKIKMIENNSSQNGNVEHTYVYYEDGSYTDTLKNNTKILSIIDYNENDKIIKGINFEQQSSIYTEIDDHGNYTKRKTTFADGPGNEVNFINEYDTLGNLTRKILDQRYREYEYNENGDVTKETQLDTGERTNSFLYNYKYFE